MNKAQDIISAEDFGKITAFCIKHGVDISKIIGHSPGGKTRKQVADEMRAYLKALPKA